MSDNTAAPPAPIMPRQDFEPPKSTLLDKLEAVSKIIGFFGVGAGAIGAMLQFYLNSQAESRQRYLAELQADIEISGIFSELVQTANGYDKFSEPQAEAIKVIASKMPDGMIESLLKKDPRTVANLFSGSRISSAIPLSRQIAAAESIANLSIKYPILAEPGLSALEVIVSFMPQARGAYDRVLKKYNAGRRPGPLPQKS